MRASQYGSIYLIPYFQVNVAEMMERRSIWETLANLKLSSLDQNDTDICRTEV